MTKTANLPKRRRTTGIIITGILLLMGVRYLLVSVWFSPEIRARVVTPDGKPVARAIIGANWDVADWTYKPLRHMAVMEAETDENGSFSIPQWGPEFVWYGTLLESEPTIRIFKPSYIPVVLNNTRNLARKEKANIIIRFTKQDQEIVMRRFNGSSVEYERELFYLLHILTHVFITAPYPNAECLRKDMPRMLNALQQVKDRFTREGVDNTIRDIKDYSEFCVRTWRFSPAAQN
jgi:hypothetical protein